jgi:hypothetical protein
MEHDFSYNQYYADNNISLDEVTFEFWFKLPPDSLADGTAATIFSTDYVDVIAKDDYSFYLTPQANNPWEPIQSFELNTWYHFSIVTVGDSITVFINGEKVVDNVYYENRSRMWEFRIEADIESYYDEVRIWGLALSENNIRDTMHKSFSYHPELIHNATFNRESISESNDHYFDEVSRLYFELGREFSSGYENIPAYVIADAPIYQYDVEKTIDVDEEQPLSFKLNPNYPNPFNPSTTIAFELPEREMTTLIIYSVTGQAIRTIVDGTLDAGRYEYVWDGRNDSGLMVSSGVYLMRLRHGKQVQTGKMLLLK